MGATSEAGTGSEVWIYACYFDLLCRDLSITKFFGRFQQLAEKYSVIRLHMTRDDIDNFM
jgi:hypothetical protein